MLINSLMVGLKLPFYRQIWAKNRSIVIDISFSVSWESSLWQDSQDVCDGPSLTSAVLNGQLEGELWLSALDHLQTALRLDVLDGAALQKERNKGDEWQMFSRTSGLQLSFTSQHQHSADEGVTGITGPLDETSQNKKPLHHQSHSDAEALSLLRRSGMFGLIGFKLD